MRPSILDYICRGLVVFLICGGLALFFIALKALQGG
jgi:hypothetical protein